MEGGTKALSEGDHEVRVANDVDDQTRIVERLG